VVRKPRIVLTNTRVDDLPKEIWKLLEEFTDIVVDELPRSLPLLRTKHQYSMEKPQEKYSTH
jgi:hypothetical protein